MQSPPIMPATWAPEMGIKFGGPSPPGGQVQGQNKENQGAKSPNQGWPGQGGMWDPNKGFQFG